MRDLLIIGSTGFLGRRLKEYLTAEGIGFRTCDRSASGGEEAGLIPDSHLREATVVFLLAAHIPYGRMDKPSRDLIAANLELPLRVLGAVSPETRIVLASTVSVYGMPLCEVLAKGHPYNSPNSYALSKLGSESIIGAQENHVILRFPSLFGPGMTRSTFIPRIVEDARERGRITLRGDGGRLQNYLHGRRAARMLVEAARETGRTGVHHAVHERSYSNREVADLVADLVPGTEIVHEDTDDSPSYRYEVSRWLAEPTADPADELETSLGEILEPVDD